MQSVIGIDVSKTKFDICLIIESKNSSKVFDNNASGFKSFLSWINSKRANLNEKPKICTEATGSYMELLTEFMYDNGFAVSIVNPLLIKEFKSPKLCEHKTDKVDAQKIALYCRQNNPNVWKPQAREYRELRDVCRIIAPLKVQLTQENNRLETRFISEAAKNAIEKVIEREQIKNLENERKRIVSSSKEMTGNIEKIMKINGVGFVSACTIIAEADHNNFKDAKKFAAFFGITPLGFESGSSVKKKSRISKIGEKHVRSSLFMGAMSVKRHKRVFAPFISRLENRGKKPKQIICAIMQKIIHLIFGVLKNNQDFNAKLAFGC
jgi:transposase